MSNTDIARYHGLATYTLHDGSPALYWTPARSIDGDDTTEFKTRVDSSKLNTRKRNVGSVSVTFPNLIDPYIETVEFRGGPHISGDDTSKSNFQTVVSYFNPSGTEIILGDHSNEGSTSLRSYTVNSRIRSIKVYLAGSGLRTLTANIALELSWFYIKAIGPNLPSSTVVVRGDSESYKLARDVDDLSPVKFPMTYWTITGWNGFIPIVGQVTTNRHLLLVETSSILATPVRIQTDSGIKAFARSFEA